MRIQSGITPEIKNSIVMKAAFGGETPALQSELKTDAVRRVDVAGKEQRVANMSLKIQTILEKMDTEKVRAAEPSHSEQEMITMHNKLNNRSGHMDMMV